MKVKLEHTSEECSSSENISNNHNIIDSKRNANLFHDEDEDTVKK